MTGNTIAELQPGLYITAAASFPDLVSTAQQLDYHVATADLATCRDKHDLLERLARALHFPDWFGHNWDALADCLLDLDWLPARGHVLLLSHCAEFANTAPEAWHQASSIMAEVTEQRAQHELPMWVFCDDAGPASEAPDR